VCVNISQYKCISVAVDFPFPKEMDQRSVRPPPKTYLELLLVRVHLAEGDHVHSDAVLLELLPDLVFAVVVVWNGSDGMGGRGGKLTSVSFRDSPARRLWAGSIHCPLCYPL